MLKWHRDTGREGPMGGGEGPNRTIGWGPVANRFLQLLVFVLGREIEMCDKNGKKGRDKKEGESVPGT